MKLRHKDIVGVVCKGRLGLGNYETVHWKTASPKEKRHLVVQQIRQTEEDKRLVKAVGMAQQGAWTRWESAMDRNLSWKDLWTQSEGSLRFLLRPVSDLLPTQTNLQLWGKKEDASCIRCGASRCNLQHILSACSKSLSEGRYRWRHDKVLKEIAAKLDQARLSCKQPDKSHRTNIREWIELRKKYQNQKIPASQKPYTKNTFLGGRVV